MYCIHILKVFVRHVFSKTIQKCCPLEPESVRGKNFLEPKLPPNDEGSETLGLTLFYIC